MLQESLLCSPAQRPGQAGQTLWSLGKPMPGETTLVVELYPHAGLWQQKLISNKLLRCPTSHLPPLQLHPTELGWLQVEMTSFAGRLVAGASGLRAGRCSECTWAQFAPQLVRADSAQLEFPRTPERGFVLLLAWSCSLVCFEARGAPP